MKRALLKSAVLAVLILSAAAIGKVSTASNPSSGQLGREVKDRLAAKPTAVTTPTLGNYPATSIPLSTNTTVTPDAAPTNTTRIIVFTSTNFKGRLEGYSTTGVVRVTDAHPGGKYTVTVRAFDSDGASATKTFTLTVTTPAVCTPVSFERAVNFGVGDNPLSIALGDFNGDGNQDLVVPSFSLNNVWIFLGDGMGNFSAPINFGVGSQPVSVAVGDFNGDGNQDLAVVNRFSSNVSILLGDGAAHFSAPTNFGVGNNPRSVAVGDFNGDGNQDLAVANGPFGGSNNVSILLGDGAGCFGTATNFDAATGPVSITVGDFNGDGKQDLAVGNVLSNNVSILLGDGMGNFGAAANIDVGGSAGSVVVGDFNVDGNQDLALANGGNTVSILLGDGFGHFGAATNFAAGSLPSSVAVGDFNGDGKQDLAVANHIVSPGRVLILVGDGAGNFAAPINFNVGNDPASVVVGDFNGDGRQDLAVTTSDGLGNVSILLRDCAVTPISAVSRKIHGSAGSFDLSLPLTDSPGIECRSGGSTDDYTIVVTFASTVTVNGKPQAEIIAGMGAVGSGGVSNGGMVTIGGNTVTVPLTNVANAQNVEVWLHGVIGGSGSGNLTIPMSVLIGDTEASGAVNSTDITQTKARLGQTLDATNFRSDVNANGRINTSDVAIIKWNEGTRLPQRNDSLPTR